MIWLIWIVAAPGVTSQGCSPLGGGTDQEHGELLSREQLEKGSHRDGEGRLEATLRTGAQAGSPGTSVTQVSVFGQVWLCAQGHPVLVQGRMNQASTLGAVFCLYCWLVAWDLIPAQHLTFPFLRRSRCFLYILFFLLSLILLAITAVPGSYLWLL